MVKHIAKIAYGSDVYYIKDTEARFALIDKAEKGAANGVATLDSNGLVPTEYIPASITNSVGSAYGVCSTESNVAEKSVTISDSSWNLKVGSIIGVKFINTNVVDSDSENIITLNVNSTGAKSILYDGSANPTGVNPNIYGSAGKHIYYMYDGTYWVWLACGFIVDTKNTAGATDTQDKIYIIGATSQNDNQVTYSQYGAYVGTDGCVYSDGHKVITSHQDISGKVDQTDFDTLENSIKTNGTLGTTITSAERTAWNAKADSSLIGAANGIAQLDENGKVPSSQLPSYVDDVIEANDFASFPVTGEAGKIYVSLDDNKTYRWGGTSYVQISESLAIGTTSGTACEGNDSRLSDSRPASDVYAWAKQENKPVYTPSEVGSYSSMYSVTENMNNLVAPESVVGASNTGKTAHVLYMNTGNENYTIAVSTASGYITPNGDAIELTCPENGYCEVSYLNVNGTIFVRGL